MPTNFLGRFTLIAIVLFAALWAIFPQLPVKPLWVLSPSVPLSDKHNLKPGIDMVGGTSLLYEIKVPEGGASTNLSSQVMDALKKRVDPEGVKNLVWRPQGATRLEIQMPLTGKGNEATAAREAYAKARTDLEATTIRLGTVLDAITRLQGDARSARLTALAQDSATRQEVFAGILKASDELTAARARRDAAAQARAELELEALKARVNPTSIDVAELEQKLNVVEEKKEKGEPADADLAGMIQKLKNDAKDYPSRAAAIDKFIVAHQAYFKIRNQLDAASDLKRLLQGSGVLEYHILVERSDPRVPEMLARLENGQGTGLRSGDSVRWGVVDKPDQFRADGVIRQYAGRTYVLLDLSDNKSMTAQTGQKWALKGAAQSINPQTGEAQVAFQLDAAGGIYMGRLTGSNLQKPMAIVLDDKVISAPTVQSQINDSGVITGRYTPAEINYLVNTLNAGSLPATLAEEPISERTVGSTIGADNLRAGFLACGVGLIVVGVFLMGYYYLSGAVAFIAVLLNLLLIIGSLAALNATFTLPGVAALVLSLGTAVDANVLIFERLREEQARGLPIKMALRNAYDRAFSAIVDSNVVTAITSLVLYVLGSEEVKGFGLTLLIGIVVSLFTSLFVTKTIFGVLVTRFDVRRLGSFPQTFPAWDRALKPNFDWMGKVWILGGASAAVMFVGLVLFGYYVKKNEMMDIEFSSGTAVTIDLKAPEEISKVRGQLEAAANREIIVAAGKTADAAAASATDRKVRVADAIPSPSVVAVGTNGLTYEIVTPNVDVPAVRAAIFEVFKDSLKIEVPSTFSRVGARLDDVMNQMVFPVEGLPPVGRFVPEQWGEFPGGVAIYLEGISPPLSPEEIQSRIANQRLQPGAGGGSRSLPPVVVYAPTGPKAPTTEAVVLALDPKILADEDREKWSQDVAAPVWQLVNDAINRPPNLARVSNFDAQVAGEFQQDALVAISLALVVIMAYVWVRFGNLRYGTANTVALLHDTFFIIAALGLAHFFCEHLPGLAGFLLVEPFRVNLTIVAGILTIMGYSMVDTIVVFDRIREIRGQRGTLTRQVINDAINQTLSRTLLTAGTTLATLTVMYIFGGPGIHGFTYILLIGILVGTYSSIAVAAPLLMVGLGKDAGMDAKANPGTAAKDAKLQQA